MAKNNSDILGARMMGGGFGGCTINIIKKEGVDTFKNEVSNAYKKRFQIDCSFYNVNLSQGTTLVN